MYNGHHQDLVFQNMETMGEDLEHRVTKMP